MFSLTPWEPFRALRRRDDVFDEMFRDFFRRGAEEGATEPAVEMAESDGEMTVKMEVPGVEKDQIQLTVADDHLVVRGEAARRIVNAVGAALEHDALEDVAQGIFQGIVAGNLRDLEMDGLIVDQTLPGEAVSHVVAIGIHSLAQHFERLVSQLLDGFFDGEGLEGFAQLIKLLGLL